MKVEGYKNILANKYMRDSGCYIIKDTDDLIILEEQWNNYCKMNITQRKSSDYKSMDIWNMNNKMHYEILKESLSKLDVVPEESSYDEDSDNIERAKNISQETNIPMITMYSGGSISDMIKDLDDQYNKYKSQSADKQRIADDRSLELFGLTNEERYDKLKRNLVNNLDSEGEVYKLRYVDGIGNEIDIINTKLESIDLENNSKEDVINEVSSSVKDMTFVSKCYLNHILEQDKNISNLNNTPYFTPSEMVNLGVYSDNNIYSDISDNEALTDNMTSLNWFLGYIGKYYKGIISEDYTKEWISKLESLYSNYEDILSEKDNDKILSRKQSILDLGWNPEIPFTIENRIKASKRINNIRSKEFIKDNFIKLDDIKIDESNLNNYVELARDKKYSPVFLIFTKGKTPVVSDAIRKFTGSEFTHASISFDPSLNNMYSFMMNPKNHHSGLTKESIKSNDLIKGFDISVYMFLAENNIVDKMKKDIQDYKLHDTKYNINILLLKMANLDRVSKDKYKQVCSTFVNNVLQTVNIKLTDKKLPAPSDLINSVKNRNNIFEIYAGNSTLYDITKIEPKINYLINNLETKSIHECISLNEVKQFPVDFDDDGNLIIYKCITKNICYGDVIDDSSKLLKTYRNTHNQEGAKYELAKLWFIMSCIEKELINKKIDESKRRELSNNLNTANNIFKQYFEYICKADKDFNFSDYYNNTPFSDNATRISGNLIKYSLSALKQLISV